ncbi:hypothetical protein MM300_02280 [Evansella sp. LMS18]|uniref:hypothetical protein n=1 Tax=Evansella sp. LMS18 TaxID=2924033 RepID=UPI0020D1473C|nr:hypothetical protein [Evansella sp. LMS18]UTR11181.1 hypothetical protein MM300_02280 [Evansella sp. LMS18]
METEIKDGKIELTFLAENEHGLPSAGEDFHYSFPAYIFDTEDIPYKITDMGIVPAGGAPNGERVFVHLQLSPAPNGKNTTLNVPLTVFPAVFEDGYIFRMEKSSHETIIVGELEMKNITADETTISFLLIDHHPEKNSRNLSYSYRIAKGDNSVYPVHTSSKPDGKGTFIEVTFANPVSFPAEFIIDRTSAYIPEMRTLFHIPLREPTP